MSPLEVILEYEMKPLEAKAYKLCVLWDTLVRKEFPGERYTKLRRKGDPRKSTLFKYCYKLVRETNGLIPNNEYKIYIMAQLHVLKLQNDGKVHALIDPCILVGDKAWKRWKLWKKYYDHQLSRPKTEEESDIKEKKSRVLINLNQTKKFLEKEGVVSLEKLKEKLADLSLIRWISLGKISPHYAILSPWISKALDGKTLEDVFLFDLSVYHQSIDDDVRKWFSKNFSEEFND
jgi:hypothetical protein